MIDFFVVEPRPFHLAHFTTQHRVPGGVVTGKADLAYRVAAAGVDLNMQRHTMMRVIDFRRGRHLRPGITILTKTLFDLIFNRGDLRPAIPCPRQRLGKGLDLRSMLRQVACHLSSVDLITFAFIEGDGDIQGFFIWRHTDLRGLDRKARIAAIEIKTAQRFQIGFQLLFLIFFIRYHIPPRHIIA